MLKWIEATGKTEDLAIQNGLLKLGLDRDSVSVEVLERAKKGLFGLGGTPARVKLSYEAPDEPPAPQPDPKPAPKAEPQPDPKPAPKAESKPDLKPAPKAESKPEPKPESRPTLGSGSRFAFKTEPRKSEWEEKPVVSESPTSVGGPASTEISHPFLPSPDLEEKIRMFLSGLLEHMEVEAKIQVSLGRENSLLVTLEGSRLGAIIGHRGETLDAIQQLTNYAVNKDRAHRVRIYIDAENYRTKREEALKRLATKVAWKVVKYHRNITLEPMNAYERHVIHEALQDYPNVITYSTGIEPNRRTVVAFSRGKYEY